MVQLRGSGETHGERLARKSVNKSACDALPVLHSFLSSIPEVLTSSRSHALCHSPPDVVVVDFITKQTLRNVTRCCRPLLRVKTSFEEYKRNGGPPRTSKMHAVTMVNAPRCGQISCPTRRLWPVCFV